MRQVDRKSIQELGIPEMVLMENAGKAVVEFLQEQFKELDKKSITIIAGTGNNAINTRTQQPIQQNITVIYSHLKKMHAVFAIQPINFYW